MSVHIAWYDIIVADGLFMSNECRARRGAEREDLWSRCGGLERMSICESINQYDRNK